MESHRHNDLPFSNGFTPVPVPKQHPASKRNRNSPATESTQRATDQQHSIQQHYGTNGVSQYNSSKQRGHPSVENGGRDLQHERRPTSWGSVSAGSRLSWAPQDTQPHSPVRTDTLNRERRVSDTVGPDSQSALCLPSSRQALAADRMEGRMRKTRKIQHLNDDEGEESPSAVRVARRESISASVAVPRKIQPADIKRLTPPKPESGFMQAVGRSSEQARPRLDLTQLEARIKALSASRAERLQLDNTQPSVPAPTSPSGISTRPIHSQLPKQPRIEVKAGLLNGKRSGDLIGNLGSLLDKARTSDNGEVTSTEGGSSFEDSKSEDSHPRHFSAIQREIRNLHASLEQSKLESQRLQQRLLEKIDQERPPGRERAISSSPLTEQGARLNHASHTRLRRRHEQPWQGSETHQAWPASSVRRRNPLDRHHRVPGQFGTTKESSESEASYSSGAAHWRNRQVTRSSNGLQPRTLSHASSSDHSEYRFLETQVPPDRLLDVGQPTLFPKSASLSRQRKGRVLYRLFKHCTKALIYLIMFSAIQVLLMGLLFRPTYGPDVHRAKEFEKAPKTLLFRGREYAADQRGFFTFLDAGFGTETLAYCHDLWAFTGDSQVPRQPNPPVLHRALDSVAHFGAVVVDTVAALVHERSTSLRG